MTKVAILGLGAMGSRMAKRLIDAGHDLTVWNRSPERTEPLRASGAAVATTPRDAAAGRDVAIAMVRDDDASRAVWLDAETGALGGLGPKAIAVESSTLSLDWTRELARRSAETGISFLDAPVAGSRSQAEAGRLVYMVGGEAEPLACVRPLLEAMGGAVHHAGPASAGAAMKLAVNALLGVQVCAIAELLGILRDAGLDIARAVEIIGATPVCSPAARAAADSMLAGNFAPMFPVELVEKDLDYLLAAARRSRSAPIAAVARRVFSEASARGLSGDNLTSVARLYDRSGEAGSR